MKICHGYILNTSEIFVIAIIYYDEVHISICKTDEYHAIILIINKIDIIIKAIDISVVIFTIIHKILLLDIVIQGRKLQILAYVFMLPFNFMQACVLSCRLTRPVCQRSVLQVRFLRLSLSLLVSN